VVKRGNGKPQVVIDGVSGSRAYAVLTASHHRDEMPEKKQA
jgi:hypothetical protein